MFPKAVYTARRAELRRRMPAGGIVLLPGNGAAPANYPHNAYPFRQDSSFLYYFGQQLADLVGWIDLDSGEEVLYGEDATVDDIIWTGPQPTVRELADRVGVPRTGSLGELERAVDGALRRGRRIHLLPPYRAETKLNYERLTGIRAAEVGRHLSVDLILAVASMREVKGPEEIEELERAFQLGYRLHTMAMRMCRPGVTEREIAGAIAGLTQQYGWGVSFAPIVSQHGETLHNSFTDAALEAGRLLLVDAGAETAENYCSDHTRTYPVDGRFTPRQREVYEAVLAAHDRVAEQVAPGQRYMDVHNLACEVLAEGLIGLGLIRGDAREAVAAGAMELFMPHGLGHGMGLDVHDCEAFGERGGDFDFKAVAERAAEAGSCIQRSAWRLQPGTVMTDEPGLYFIPALIEKWRNEGRLKGMIAYDKLREYVGFGGIRIEDDLLVTATGNRMIGGDVRIPVTIEQIESFMAASRA